MTSVITPHVPLHKIVRRWDITLTEGEHNTLLDYLRQNVERVFVCVRSLDGHFIEVHVDDFLEILTYTWATYDPKNLPARRFTALLDARGLLWVDAEDAKNKEF